MTLVTYRSHHAGLRPRRLRLEIPGWTGAQQPRADGAHEQPWHCVPFTEAARAGIELPYPGEAEVAVTREGGQTVFREGGRVLAPGAGPPFRRFGAVYFTWRSSLDLKVPAGLALRVETHPRFYTDTTGEVPVAVPALLQAWWPMIHFLVFKAPREGERILFRPGEPMALVVVVPADQAVAVAPMPAEEAAERELQSRRIYASRTTLGAGTRWTSDTGTIFDGTYRLLAGAARGAAGREVLATASRGDADGRSPDRGDGGDRDDGAHAGAPPPAGRAAAAHGGHGRDGDGGDDRGRGDGGVPAPPRAAPG